jgi:hypothetical protein
VNVQTQRRWLALQVWAQDNREDRFRLWLETTVYEAAVLLMIEECGRLHHRSA